MNWTSQRGWKVTPRDILETEGRWPGLWADLNVELWQRKKVADLLKEQRGQSPTAELERMGLTLDD